MGRRGPAPAPAKLKLLRGETRPSRVNYREPRPLPGLPERPADLIAGAEIVWQRSVAALAAMGVLSGADRDLLRVYAETVVRYEQAATLYATTGPLIVGARRGELVKNPLAAMVRDLGSQVQHLGRELGLSPAGRASLHAAESAAPGARLAAFLAEGRRA
jgi:P27 family predicted phage terminase small subunit